MKNKVLRLLLPLVLMVLAAFSAAVCAAAASDPADSAESYENPYTGYRVVIADEKNLLTSKQRAKLCEDMKPLTKYGSVAFWTTGESTTSVITQAGNKRYELFKNTSSSIFSINMANGEIAIESVGEMHSIINDSYARSITDNVKGYAKNGEYYVCAHEAFSQMYTLLEGGYISEPMKYISYAVIAAMLGVILALAVAFSCRFNPLSEENNQFSKLWVKGCAAKDVAVIKCGSRSTVTKSRRVATNVAAFALEIICDGLSSGGGHGGGHSGGSSSGGHSSGGGGSASFR